MHNKGRIDVTDLHSYQNKMEVAVETSCSNVFDEHQTLRKNTKKLVFFTILENHGVIRSLTSAPTTH